MIVQISRIQRILKDSFMERIKKRINRNIQLDTLIVNTKGRFLIHCVITNHL